MKIVRILAVLAPMLAFAASDSTAAKRGWLGVYTDDLSKPMLAALDIDALDLSHQPFVVRLIECNPGEISAP